MTDYFVTFIHMCLQWIIAFKNDSKGLFRSFNNIKKCNRITQFVSETIFFSEL